MKKILLFLGVGLIVLIVVVVVGVGMFLGPIVKAGVETLGPKITQVPVKVQAVDMSVLSGSAVIKGLHVGNPEGFTTPEAISLGKAEVKLDPGSVLSDKIVVHKIHVESPEITYDGGLGGSNLTKIMDNVNATAQKDGSEPSASPDQDKTSKPAPKIQVDDFLITGAKVHVHVKGLSQQDLTVTLPDIHLTNLGKDSEGITPAELVRVVLGQITTSTVKAVTQTVAGSGKLIEDLGKDISKKPGEAIKSVTEGIGGLFGK